MSAERRDLRGQLDAVTDQLVDLYFDPDAKEMQHIGSYDLPSDVGVAEMIEDCRALLFPGYAGPDVTGTRPELREAVRGRVAELRANVRRQVYRALRHKQQLLHDRGERINSAAEADAIADRFVARLPELRSQIRLDLLAAYEADPAATGVDEILLCYPGTFAITVYRLAHALLREGAIVIPRMMGEIAHRRTGIDIHPGATIGRAFFIDHGTGVVIGETTLIGDRVRIYQGVTLGALTVPKGEARPEPDVRRHPTIEDEVVIYANATILGGDTVIGKGAVIGGNAFVTSSVAPGGRVSGSSRTRRPSAMPPC
jgi:serine O-acetyltransferase